MDDQARVHYDRGIELYAAKDYAGAIRELEAGYAIDPRREFLFAQAQALRLSGDCTRAVPLYQKFLASEPNEVQVNATHIGLSRCAQQLASAKPTAEPRAAPVTNPIGPLVSPAPPPAPPPWYRDPLGAALLGAGALGLGTGALFMASALSERDAANRSASSYAEYARRWDLADGRWRIGIVTLAAGTALTGAAIYRYVRVRRRAHETTAARITGAWLAPGAGGGLALGAGAAF
jgi:tetratricopeptide (TPR) repeat protein